MAAYPIAAHSSTSTTGAGAADILAGALHETARRALAGVHEQVAGLLGDPGSTGVGGDPGKVDARVACSITTRM
jgi:hypothetical protein